MSRDTLANSQLKENQLAHDVTAPLRPVDQGEPPKNRGPLIAAGIFGLMILWMGSKYLTSSGAETLGAPLAEEGVSLRRVQVIQQQATEIEQEIIINGKTAPVRFVALRAEIAGKITHVHQERGVLLNAGDNIFQIDERDLKAQLNRTKALVKQRQVEYKGSQRLTGKGLVSQTKVAESVALLESAKADAKAMQVKLDSTSITAPFGGILNERYIELGDYVKEGDKLADLLDFSHFVILGEISEKDASSIKVGYTATISIVTGEKYQGTVKFISSVSNPATRTFLIKVAVPNPSNRFISGMTARVRIPYSKVFAHTISPALLSLDNQGELGIYLLDDENRAKFYPISVLKADNEGLWIKGLPEHAAIITLGQGFVKDGEQVEPITANSVTSEPTALDASNNSQPE